MGDGFWDTTAKTVVIFTDNFTLAFALTAKGQREEVELLISVLSEKFGLISTVQKRTKANKEVCWRIRFSNKTENIEKLKNLVQPYFIPTMLYKLNIENN